MSALEGRKLDRAVAAFDERMQQIRGCGNHGCVIDSPKEGEWGTNAICQCWANKMKMQRYAFAVNDLLATVRAVATKPDAG